MTFAEGLAPTLTARYSPITLAEFGRLQMTEPRNYREANIARQGLEDRVDLLQKWLWGLAGLLGTVLAAAVAISCSSVT